MSEQIRDDTLYAKHLLELETRRQWARLVKAEIVNPVPQRALLIRFVKQAYYQVRETPSQEFLSDVLDSCVSARRTLDMEIEHGSLPDLEDIPLPKGDYPWSEYDGEE